MKKLILAGFAASALMLAPTMSASALPIHPLSPVASSDQSDVIQVRGHGGGRGHHFGWGRGRGHHYGWSRGRHRGWR